MTSNFFRVLTIPVLSDNYGYLLVHTATKTAAAIDVSDPAPVLSALKSENLQLTSIFSTHHHNDHTAGNEHLASQFKDLKVYGRGIGTIVSILSLKRSRSCPHARPAIRDSVSISRFDSHAYSHALSYDWSHLLSRSRPEREQCRIYGWHSL